MKKNIIICALITIATALALTVNGQHKVKEDKNGNYISVHEVSQKGDTTTSTSTGKTWPDSKGIVYPVFRSKNGKLFVYRVSRNTGQSYKYYLKME